MGKINEKRIYWTKIPVDFWERPEVILLMAQEHGAAVLCLFLEMISRSANTFGNLRFTDAEPYTVDTLAIVFHVSRDLAQEAIILLNRFGFIIFMDDKTIHIVDAEMYIASETIWADYKRRERKKTAKPRKSSDSDVGQCPNDVQTKSLEIEIELEKDIEIDKENQHSIVNNTVVDKRKDTKQPQPLNKPTIEEVKEYIQANNKVVDPEAFVAYYDERGWKTDNGRSMVAFWKERVDKLDLISRDRAETSGGSSEPVPYMQKDYKEEIRDHVDDLDDLLGNDGE